MNERIRELVKQAGGISHDDDGNELTPALVGKSLEKFAELIVQECMQVGFNAVYELADDSKAVAVYQNIQEHFGVEL